MTNNKESYFEQKINKKEGANVADLSEDDRSYVVNLLKISSIEEKINHLKEIQENFDNLLKEKADFEAKYRKLSQEYYTTRYKIVNGVAKVEGVTNETTAEAEENGVPLFWLNTMKNNKELAEEIMECDKDALKYLEDIECTTIDDPKGFVLKFSFKSNHIFSTHTWKRHFIWDVTHQLKQLGLLAAFWFYRTEIGWFEEKCLTLDKEYNPQKSFFNFFEDIDNGDEEEFDEYMIWELQLQIERHYDISETIKNMIIPHAVSWYTNAAQGEEIGVVDSSDKNDEEEETETKEGEEIGLADSSDENNEEEEETETKQGEEIGVVDSSDEKDEGEEETKTKKEHIIATSFCDKTYDTRQKEILFLLHHFITCIAVHVIIQVSLPLLLKL
ncbi:nucleosome assembly protein 1-like 4 isoform X1 [Trifolium pratense]|uniref:nucleosome assembly protein 1-like 4 isoform X1 n=1 Tax=Trifolium pratense TaxID=57577 RepID=UPI001E6966B2|nr:nucleosome assembly protein 1-like 4 isoform X1 [Trifolium pratense]